ncbi:MAG: GNAT family N-acetyltransferase, partial [Oscillospiraceae bacterium]|nr:GNAT family N-acetyltransferase [Oscillospiraceae bacterium]
MEHTVHNIAHLTHTGTQDIETKRLRLRRFVMGDANQMFREWASEPNVTKYLTWEPHKSVSETKTVLMTWINDYLDISKYIWA